MTKTFFVALALALLTAAPPAEAAKDRVVIGLRLEPPVLDPTANPAAAISEVTQLNVFESLTRIDATGKVLPGLAESWTASDDSKVYTFKLRAGVKFHDGTPLEASQVKFSFERNAADTSTNKMKPIFVNMAAVETPDAATVKITLKKASSLLPYSLSEAPAAIFTPGTVATNATNPIGTGPYKFEKWVKGDQITLVKNADYREAAKIALDRVTFRFIGDDSAQVSAILAGDVDYVPIIGALELIERFKKDPQFQVLVGTTEGETLLDINNKQKPFDDVRVRRALGLAIDRKAIIDGAMSGYGTPIGSHFAPHHPYYLDLTSTSPYDPAKAKALLKEAGVPAGLEVTLKLPPPTYARRGGEIVAAQLAAVGINAKIVPLEWAQWLDTVFKQKQYDLTIVSHVEPMDILRYANPEYLVQYDSAEFRAIIERADATANPDEQKRLFQDAQRKLAEDAPVSFLFQLAKVGVARKGLQGMWLNAPAPVYEIGAMSWSN